MQEGFAGGSEMQTIVFFPTELGRRLCRWRGTYFGFQGLRVEPCCKRVAGLNSWTNSKTCCTCSRPMANAAARMGVHLSHAALHTLTLETT